MNFFLMIYCNPSIVSCCAESEVDDGKKVVLYLKKSIFIIQNAKKNTQANQL